MSSRLVSAAALIALALVTIFWLGHDLHGVVADAHGRAAARTVLDSVAPSRAHTLAAISQFDDAADFNVDPTPRIDEARLLLGLRRNQAAADVLDGVVRDNPGNVLAWSLLATATAATDPSRAEQALQRLRVLFGHPPGEGPEKGFLLSPRGVTEVVPGQLLGHVDFVLVGGGEVEFIGWAGAPATGAGTAPALMPVDSILLASGGRVIATVTPTLPRSDVERTYPGLPGAKLGFRLYVPIAKLRTVSGFVPVKLFASLRGIGSPLPATCGRQVARFACGG